MDGVGVARALAGVVLIIAAAAGLFALAAAMADVMPLAGSFAVTAAVGGFFGGAILVGARGGARRGGPREAVLFLILAWIVTPALAAPGLFIDEGGWARSYFDALSALTTTGFPPVFSDMMGGGGGPAEPEDLLRALWWNALQWLGGAGSIVAIVCVLAAFQAVSAAPRGRARGALFVGARGAALDADDVLARFAPAARAVAGPYGGATLLVFLIALAGGENAGDSACIAMAAVSTGGLVLTDGGGSLAGASLMALAAAALGLAVGALSFPALWETVRSGLGRGVARDPETVALAALIVLWLVVALAIDSPRTGMEAGRVAFEVLALATTAGWEAGALGVNAFGAPLVFAAVLFGGAAASTTGGLKLRRVILLISEIGDELRALAHPSSVSHHPGGARRSAEIAGLGAYAVGFAAAVGGLMIALGAARAPYEVAAAGAVAAVANAGPALHITVGARDAEALLNSPSARAALSGGMILGRVEVLAAFTLLLRAFWRG